MFLLSDTVPHRENFHKFWFFSQVSGLLSNMRNGPLALSTVRLDTIDGCLAFVCGQPPGWLLSGRGDAAMPNDAKLGFALGLAVVITVSAVFYRKAGPSVSSLAEEVKAAAVPSRKPVQIEGAQSVKARPAVRTKTKPPEDTSTTANIGLFLDGESPEDGNEDHK